MVEYRCYKCGWKTMRKCSYDRHMKRKNPCVKTDRNSDTEISKLKAQIKELRNEIQLNIKDVKDEIKHNKLSNIKELKDVKEEIKNAPTPIVNQNILQVLCVGSNDNYLDMLTDYWGNFDQALDYVKNCALSDVNGDCKLLSRIYFDSFHNGKSQLSKVPIRRNRKKLTYIDENKDEIVDPTGIVLGKKLAGNLQNTYLKGINHLINKNLDNKFCPNKFLDAYDLQSWNRHIYELSEVKYHKKIMKNLEIPEQLSN